MYLRRKRDVSLVPQIQYFLPKNLGNTEPAEFREELNNRTTKQPKKATERPRWGFFFWKAKSSFTSVFQAAANDSISNIH